MANNVRRVVDAQSPDSALPRHASAWTPLDASGSRSLSNCHQPHDASGKPASGSRPCGETNSRWRSTTRSALKCTHSRPPRSGGLNVVGSRALILANCIIPGMKLRISATGLEMKFAPIAVSVRTAQPRRPQTSPAWCAHAAACGQSGVARDYVEAHMWYDLAASRMTGEDRGRAVEARDRVAEALTPAALNEAQRLAREWDAAHPREP